MLKVDQKPLFIWAKHWNVISKKIKQIYFSKENYLNYTHKKDTIKLHLTITFCLKQGETRTSNRPITVSLRKEHENRYEAKKNDKSRPK